MAISLIRLRSAPKNTLEIFLKESASQLNEVVVVGYGTQDRKNLVGSVTQVNADEIKNRPVASFDQQLQGRAAGVQVAANTGIPGDGIFFRIRGTTSINASNDPLYVVDGVFVNNQSLQKITTQGQANNPLADINPPTLSLNASVGQAWAPKLWDLVTGPEHATIINEAWINDGKPAAARPFRSVSEGGRGLPEEQQTYDRLHDIFRTGALQNYDVVVSGGTKQTRFYIGGGYTSQQATLRTNDFSRASFKLNLDQDITDKIRIGNWYKQHHVAVEPVECPRG